ncbi:UAA transporter family protein [Nitzschia inconspicua]|uniref:UAA transporter family protein n=1 Tax=Nitzschia inconspicua TaxID=303405 RepID=A0A9K3Q4H3_9STRA|nr:UAA transporter family protein [Nitzschia inconspicua]
MLVIRLMSCPLRKVFCVLALLGLLLQPSLAANHNKARSVASTLQRFSTISSINHPSTPDSVRSAVSVGTPNSGTSLINVDQKMGSDNAPPGTPKAGDVTHGGNLEKPVGLPDGLKLLIGAGGIYGAFLYYGSLQEDVFRFVAPDGTKFTQAWFLQVLEALANVIIGYIGMQVTGATKGIPLRMFGISGAAQVSAKACTSLALANGLSFPVATLAKSGKMAPVMMGSLLLGGASYTVREYLQVAAIIGGTAIVSMGKKKGSGSTSSTLGVFYIVLSLVLDGVTAGFQKRLKTETAKVGVKPKPYDFMFWTNLFMCLTAIVIAGVLGEVTSGISYMTANPEILSQIVKFAICSAVGQSFIFYTIANFDPLVLSTVTTTRKIFSVLLSIFLKGHSLSVMGWSGIAMACGGILSELQDKMGTKKKKHSN